MSAFLSKAEGPSRRTMMNSVENDPQTIFAAAAAVHDLE
jgi:hypothetical protein